MDTEFKLFGIRFGIDPLFDFVPALGSFIGALTSFYLFWIAYKIDVPSRIYFFMVLNILADFLLGSIPVVGIIFDAFYKSNVRNLKLIEKFFDADVIKGEVIN